MNEKTLDTIFKGLVAVGLACTVKSLMNLPKETVKQIQEGLDTSDIDGVSKLLPQQDKPDSESKEHDTSSDSESNDEYAKYLEMKRKFEQ